MPRNANVSIKSTVYQKFRGADFSTDPALVDKTRSPLCTNMISDGGGMPEKRCGWKTIHTFASGDTPLRINGLYSLRYQGATYFYCHAGSGIYTWDETDTAPVLRLSGLHDAKSRGICLCGKLWIVTGGELLVCTGETVERVSDSMSAYIPTTIITREPDGGGTAYENVNMLSPFRRNAFQTNGSATAFLLDSTNLDCALETTAEIADETALYYDDDHAHGGKYWNFTAGADIAAGTVIVLDFEAKTATAGETVMTMTDSTTATGTSIATLAELTARSAVTAQVWGADSDAFTVCRAMGKVTFSTAPAAPTAGSADGLTVTFPKTVEGYADTINHCTILTTYGAGNSDRLIVSGNPDYPNRDYTSGLNDPSYMPDLLYADVGIEGVPIVGYCRIGSAQAIVKADNGQDTTVFFRSAQVSEDGAVRFAIQQAITGVGAVSRGSFATLLDEPLFLSGTGIYAVSSNYLTGDRVGQNRSFYINAQLAGESLTNGEAVSWAGMYLLAFPNGHVYVLDGRQNKTYRSESMGDYVYEGYYWEGIPARCWMNYEAGAAEFLYFGTETGKICRFRTDDTHMSRFSDDDAAIDAVWATKMDDDGAATILKTMLKRGCAVTLKPYYRSSAKICFRTDRDAVDTEAVSDTLDIFNWEDIDFARFTFDSNDGAREIFFNTKIKKYKRLQILIRNSAAGEGFGVYAITKQYVMGNYAKR